MHKQKIKGEPNIELEQRKVPFQLPLGHIHAVSIPLCPLIGNEGFEDMLSQCLANQFALFCELNGIVQAARQ